MVTTINREASDKSKGFRLQKFRAAFLILDAFEKNERAHVYAAIEFIEDVFFKNADLEDGSQFEESKYYAPDSSFTIASNEVLNTLISFVDIYFKFQCNSKKFRVGFYSTNKVGKENVSARTKALGINLPSKAVLLLLKSRDFSDPKLLETVKQFVTDEYRKQYAGLNKGNLDALLLFVDTDWMDFLSCIDWQFGQMDDVALKEEIKKKIRTSKYFNTEMSGKEELVLNQILELFESRQNAVDPFDKFVYGSDVKLCFKEVEGGLRGYIRLDDPVWNDWRRLPPPTDKRSLQEKILAVCSSYGKKKLQNLARKVGAARTVEDHFPDPNLYHSVKYRIFDRCEELLITEICEEDFTLTDEQVDLLIEKLTNAATSHVSELRSTYKYEFNMEAMVAGIVLDLLNECFISFDDGCYE